MTHQAPSRWQPPRRNPQHGAAAGHAPPSPRDQVRRALRLIVTAGSCAAGLCLVVGLVALVAAVTKPQPSRPTNIAATASGARGTTKLPYQPPPALVDAAHPDHGGRGPSLLHPAPGARAAVLAALAGSGNAVTPQFSISGIAWRLSWSCRCGAARAGRQLIVREVPAAGPASTIWTPAASPVPARPPAGRVALAVSRRSGPGSGCA